jgi:hypothetical protein
VSRGWVLVADSRCTSTWPTRDDRPVTSVCASVRQALALVMAGLADGVLIQSWDALDGVVELATPPPVTPPGQRRPQRLSAEHRRPQIRGFER